MLRDNIYIHPPSFLFLCLWECDISIEGRRPGHRTEYSAHVFNVKTSPAGSCSIFPQSTWALCPKRWDFLCIQVTGWSRWPGLFCPFSLKKSRFLRAKILSEIEVAPRYMLLTNQQWFTRCLWHWDGVFVTSGIWNFISRIFFIWFIVTLD